MGEVVNFKSFTNESTNWNVRIVMMGEEPWFVAKDVSEALGIRKYRDAIAKLDEDERMSMTVDTLGGPQQMTVVNEAGLYSLILTASRKPESKQFKRWVTHEVLPSIRKTGEYSVKDTTPQSYIEALEAHLQAEKEKLLLQQKLQEQQPKVEAYNVLLSGQNAQTMAQVAKAFGTGRNRLFELLRIQKVLMKNNLPYQEYLDRGYFEVREVSTTRKELTVNVTQTLVTAKGIDLIRRLLSEEID